MNRFINDTKKYWKYTLYAAKSQLKTEVANSYLNWIWWVLEPFCFMLIYAFIFGYMLGHKELYYNVYIFVGLAIWDFFNRCIKSSVRMVKRNKTIVSKVYLPKHTLIMSDMMVNAFKMQICFGLSAGMIIYYRVPIGWQALYAIPALITMIIFTFGCCCILLHLGVFIDDMANVINIVLRFVFYLTGIFYNINIFPEPIYSLVLKGNPLAFMISSFRDSILYQTVPSRKWLLFWFVISVALAAFGVRNIYKNENTYVKVI